ncbi:2-oxoglutarate dehydrogenase complex dihydrolipoyllysine-residue succinyltransferase [Gammaproteobacteria bacterium]|jgi:2-oxoglutarate dehydrogenase E2 component (dihydrolipoamide succinyltransferase)|nr:2-oxoglutarate dehydrogenase complex dihydrolipoyllysine-residue succinyltransferase [Gammaproteobacteria bacterium]MDA9079404.1 2-oxoglutarate dehydrogenase complex dihydrolipoyllysine-residue succinyltransferase [Gammaproteobacteria bacterium]MDA9142442.1 2-oxoglutarate dehydrogenase complex dihydrolipoyllysine-residue succinyltransferase [Gammaproteobacteria bacterium]MDA9259161.1 2-oxoglutarate dehydrogenase complex dihydrolipoyllysine-residue succinyltransferase [Gammaproteobacteria bact|tara:strand:- start:120 stop:1334 length:1215 start_codon:yes stop_codon:yes gene_type:complete
MATEVKSPTFPESVADGTIANWVKKEGEKVQQDEVIAEIETDKVVLEVVAPFDGVISKIHKPAGEIVQSAELIAEFEKVSNHSADNEAEQHPEPTLKTEVAPEPIAPKEEEKLNGPAATRLLKENNLASDDVVASGKGGRVTKADVVNHLSESSSKAPQKKEVIGIQPSQTGRDEERVPMSRLRATIAKRLLSVKQETAMLTTFNEVDMQPIKDLRAKYGKEFEEEHGVKLGFMGFFVLASVQALKKFPLVNASIDGNDIVYHGYQDVGVAVSTERGLVVPVIRDADNLTMAQVEQSILEYAGKARDGKLGINDMQGGTFTISNGGIYGNLLSTPILNAPQTAILGMHKIQDRPVALDGEVVIRPMMYLAMSYDHRLLDGKEAVSFLIAIKDQLESPERLLLNL